MGSNSNKIYNKAMDYYQNGEIDKALEKCEEGISQNLKNSNLLNLKGLLLYIKGDLKSATAVWNINRDFNDDEIAKVYIKDARNDNTKLSIYEWAQVDIKNLKIDEAIEKLEKCADSDFNSINVNISLATCYLKKGNCIMASEYIEKVKQVDKNNKMAESIEKQINEFFEDPKEAFKKKIIKYICVIATICIITTGGLLLVNNKENEAAQTIIENTNKENTNEEKDESVNSEKNEDDKKPAKEEQNEKDNEIDKEVEEESKYKFATNKDLQAAYIQGTEYFDSKKYDEASEILNAAYHSSIESYLKDDILFLLASSYNSNNMTKDAIEYYEEYVEKYNDKSYIKEVYYNLALLYKDSNIDLSKKYAEAIKNDYSSSIYYNSKIKDILNS